MIEAIDLSKRFGSARAVDGLSFAVRPGHVTGFLGPNGAGKSTTMRLILGLDRPTRGTVTIDGRHYGDIHRPLHQVGAVLEARAVHSGRTAYNHLLCLAQSNGIGPRRAGEVLELVGLGDAARRRAGKFSLGMSQRLGLAAALLGDPSVLICDEPVNGLDPEGIRWIRTLLRGLAAEGRTVFVSSHLMSEMALTADHLIVIGQGRLLADASTADIIAGSARNYVLVRSPEPARLGDLLRHAGAGVAAGNADGATSNTDGATTNTDGATTNTDGATSNGSVLRVTGVGCSTIGDIATRAGIPIHELTPHNASLEAVYLDLTHEHVDFRTPPDTSPTTTARGPVA